MNQILCTICARGGSKGVKNKNIRLLDGKPLIAHSIEQAKRAEIFENIVISTDSDHIAEIASQYGGEVFFRRSEELASDTAKKLYSVRDALTRSEAHYAKTYDSIIDLDATSPLRLPSDIKESYSQFVKNNNPNLITAMPSRRSPYFNLIEVDALGHVNLSKPLDNAIVRRQDAPASYDMNASIYIWTRETLLNQDTIFLPDTGLYIMPEERSIDIDTELDFEWVEFLIGKSHVS